jgi:hypothetical protein
VGAATWPVGAHEGEGAELRAGGELGGGEGELGEAEAGRVARAPGPEQAA